MLHDRKRNSISLLREYVKQMLEVKITIGNEEFDVPDKVAQKIKATIFKATAMGETSPIEQGSKPTQQEKNDYENLLKNIGIIDPAVARKLDNVVKSTKVLGDELKILLSKKDPEILANSLFKLKAAPVNSGIRVPAVLRDIARLSTNPKAGGMQIGAGEIAIRLMFDDTSEGGESNSLYDVTIAGEPWHVKAGSSMNGIKMGSAKGKLLLDTPLALKIVRLNLSNISDLTAFGQKQFADFLTKWAAAFKKKKNVTLDTPEKIYDKLNSEAIEASVGSASGVVWYENDSLFFAGKEVISIVATTQGGRCVVAVGGKEKVMSLVEAQQQETLDQK